MNERITAGLVSMFGNLWILALIGGFCLTLRIALLVTHGQGVPGLISGYWLGIANDLQVAFLIIANIGIAHSHRRHDTHDRELANIKRHIGGSG